MILKPKITIKKNSNSPNNLSLKNLILFFLVGILSSCSKNGLTLAENSQSKKTDTDPELISANVASKPNPQTLILTAGGIAYSPNDGSLYLVDIYAGVWRRTLKTGWVPYFNAVGRDVTISYTNVPWVSRNNYPVIIGADNSSPWYPDNASDAHTNWSLAGNGYVPRMASEQISGTYPTKLWGIAPNNAIYYRLNNHTDYPQSTWTLFSGGGAGIDIDAYNGTPYVIGTDNRPYYYSSGWVLLAGNGYLNRLSIDKANGVLWGIGTDWKVYSFSFSTNTWTQYPGGAYAWDVCAYNGVPYIYGQDELFYKGTGSGWIQII